MPPAPLSVGETVAPALLCSRCLVPAKRGDTSQERSNFGSPSAKPEDSPVNYGPKPCLDPTRDQAATLNGFSFIPRALSFRSLIRSTQR